MRHCASAGEEYSDSEIVPSFSGVVPFEGDADEVDAEVKSWSNVAEVLEEGEMTEDPAPEETTKRAVDNALKAVLRETHPDRAGERSFTSTEVAAIVNGLRR